MNTIYSPTKSIFKYGLLLGAFCLLCVLNSCVTNKKTTYLQELADSEFTALDSIPETYKIQPNDNLFIRVTTPDPSVSAMFNTLPVSASTMSVGEQAVDLLSYAVQQDGTVEIPYLGVVHVAGKTIPEVKQELSVILTDYVTDAAITVKLVNNYVSILGDVMQPGRYPIYKEQMNIFQALAMAHDMSPFSDRQMVQIVRKTNEGIVVKDFDLRDKNIIYSEFFYVMPNDVIYAKPMKGKFFNFNQFPFALLISTASTTILLLRYLQE